MSFFILTIGTFWLTKQIRLRISSILLLLLLLLNLFPTAWSEEVTPVTLTLADTQINGANNVTGLTGVNSIAVSPDGRHLYASSFSDAAVVVFSRENSSGKLTFVQSIKNSDLNNNGLKGASAVVVSHDNKHVYVASALDHAVVVFTRDPITGLLTLVEIQQDGINGVEDLAGAIGLAMSPDNLRLYVVGTQDNAVTAFARDTNTGTLALLGTQRDGINGVQGLTAPTHVAVSQDNIFIYVISNNAITRFTRNPTQGELGYIDTLSNGSEGVTGLNGAQSITLSPDNNHVYIANMVSSAVVALSRATSTGKLTYLQTYRNGENDIQGLGGARAVTTSPDGRFVYVASMNDNALVVFNRDATTGLLSFNNVVQNSTGLNGAVAVTTSPDGKYIYTAAMFGNAVSAFSSTATDLEVTLVAPNIVPINSPLTYTITVRNNGTDAATGITLINTLPTGVTFDPTQSSPGCSHDPNTNQVTCPLSNLEPAATTSATVTVTTPATVVTDTLTNKVTVTADQADRDLANNTVEQNTQLSEIVPNVDLAIALAANLETVSITSPLIYTITVTNQGPDLANQVILTNTLPTGVTYNATNSDPRCLENAGTVTCQLGTLAVNQPTQVAIHVTTPGTPGNLNFTTQVNSSDFDTAPANNTASKAVTVGNLQFDLVVVDAVATPSTDVNIGTDLTYTVTVANNGATQASGVTLTTTLPPQVSYVSNTRSCTHVQGTVTCILGSINPGGTQSVGITTRAVQLGTNISNTFTVSASGTDTNQSNNSKVATIHSVIGQVADFVVTVEDGGKTVLVGQPVTYTITVTNNGNTDDAATLNVSLTGNNVVDVAVTGENCGTGLSFTCQFAVIPVGQKQTVTVQTTPNQLGSLILAAEVKSQANLFDPFPLNNQVSKETAVSDKEIDLSVTLSATPNPAFLEKSFTYTITVTNNNATNQATGVTVTQELPPSVTFVSATPTQGQGCTQTNNLVTCPLGPLDPNGVANISTEVTSQSTGQLLSTATVNSNAFDPDLTNNTATIEVVVDQFTADLSLTVADSPDPAVIDSPLTYTFTVTNNGPDAATDIKLVETVPQNTHIKTQAQITPVELGGQCAEVDEVREIHCTIPSLPNQGSATMTLVVIPTEIGELTNTASLKGKEFDSNSDNNRATAITQVNNPTTLFFIETQRNGVAGVQGLKGVNALTVSADGQYVYAASFSDNAIVVFRRQDSDGRLQFFQVIRDDANGVDGLANASGVSISPDDAFVYVTGFNDTAVAVFSRDAVSGVLNFVEVHKNGLAGVTGLSGAFAIVTTTEQVYVAGSSDDAIAVFSRDAETGKLSFQEAIRFEDASQSLDGVNALAVSPDGSYLFAASLNSSRLSVFRRDPDSGHIELIQTLTNNLAGVQGLEQASGVVVSPDGNQVYTLGQGTDNAIAVFQQDIQTGVLGFVEVHRNGIAGVTGLNGAQDLVISPQGDYIYVVSMADNAIAAFRRDLTTGRLTFIDKRTDGIDAVDGLASARAVAVSPSGAHIYVAGFGDDAVAVLSIATADLNVTMSDSDDPVNVGDNIAYTLTLTNQGPHQATGIVLEEQLPEHIDLISFSPSQGQCLVVAEEGKLRCTLGSLKVGGKLTMSLVLTASEPGELSHTVTVIANEFDPTVATTTETTQVTAAADLWVDIDVTPEVARIQTPVTYTMTITNDGPHTANTITLDSEIPNSVQFNSAEITTESTPCNFDAETRTVHCAIDHIEADTNRIVTLIVTPTTEGTKLTNTVTVNTLTFDPDLLNNTAKHSMEVLLNIITEAYDNNGQQLENYLIGPTGAVIGGTLAGTIGNQGLISNAWILPNTTVIGGKLSKTITNEGVIEDVQLLSGTIINGGTIRGKITGFPTDPAIINARISAGTQLTHVIIGVNSQVDSQVKLGEGVSFKSSGNIPEGIDLTFLFPFIIEPITQSKAVNLAMDIVPNTGNLLAAINAIPEFADNNLTFSQSLTTGYLSLAVTAEHMILIPVHVSQTAATTPPQIISHADGSVTFIVQGGRTILAQPAPQSPTDIQSVLVNLGLSQVRATADGNLTILAQNQFKTRPDLHTQQISPLLPLGLATTPSSSLQGFNLFALRFIDTEGKRRQQFFYPTSAHQKELRLALQGFPGASTVEFYNTGKVSVKIGARTYSGVFDYQVKTGVESTVTQLLPVADKNGDGSEDIRIIYANGDQQLVYLLPFPEIAAEIQAIPAVQSSGYVVSQDIQGYLRLTQGNTRLVMRIMNLIQLDETTPSQMTINPDGSTEFITTSGLQVLTQPVVQDQAALEQAIRGLGVTKIDLKSNGNLNLPVTTTYAFHARPDLESTPTWLAMPIGLHNVPTSLPGVFNAMLVFRDETGGKRQQFIYPAAQYPDNLYPFFANQPSVTTVRFDNDGTVLVTGSQFNLHGKFDYVVSQSGVPTGGIQFSPIADVNGDDIADFEIIYANGEKQVIYQIP